MKTKARFTLKKMLMLFAMVPLVAGMLLAVIVAARELTTNLEEQTKNTLATASNGLKNHYEKVLASNGEIAYDTSYVDSFKGQEVELTVFQGNMRYFTSILDDAGKRIEGTKASDGVISACLTGGNDYYSDDVKINGKPYYVYYMPLKNPDGSTYGMAFAGKTCDNVNSAIRKIIILLCCCAVGLIVLFVIVALILAQKVSQPIAEIAGNIENISEGDLSQSITAVSSIAETTMLIDSATKLQQALSDIIGKTKNISLLLGNDSESVSTLSAQSSDGATQIADAMEDLAQGASGMAENVQSINEQAIEMGIAIENISANATELIESSNNIQSANQDASEYINKVSSSSVKSVEAVNSITRQIQETNEAVDRIKDAVDMISSIASQTNLLALNASIEAARAGEAGRGFAVVATEIGSLSDQSDQSAKEIKSIVSEIIEKSEQSVALSSEVAKIITDEQGYIQETQDKFTLLNQEIDASIQGISQISQKINSLEDVKNVIISSVQDLSAISEENAASNQQVSASVSGIVDAISEIARSSGDTNTRAQDLNNTVGYFK